MAQRPGERWQRRRDQIVDDAAHVFAKHSYHGTSLTDLCDATNLGRGALYYYIESKEGLLSLVHDRVMNEVLKFGQEILEGPDSPREKLLGLGRALVDIITAYPDHVWVFLHEFRNLTGENAERFRESRRQFEAMVEDVIAAGCAEGEFEVGDVRLAARGWLGLHNYIYIWYRSDGSYSPEDIASEFGHLVLNGIVRAPSPDGQGPRPDRAATPQ